MTLLKPLKGCDGESATCLESWFQQDYPGQVQILFGVGSAEDPACAVVERLLKKRPDVDAQLVICAEDLGANAKVAKLARMLSKAKFDCIVISDADVRAPGHLLSNLAEAMRDTGVGLVSCLYRLANPSTPAMRWEAIGMNADFWSQVLQARTLKPLDFGLGAVMATRRNLIEEIGGFESFANCLADDYQLGRRIAQRGHRIELCAVVVDCRERPADWRTVWQHQLRWARTIRACRSGQYFCSIVGNATLWPLLLLLAWPQPAVLGCVVFSVVLRMISARQLQRQLSPANPPPAYFWFVPVKDLLQVVVWACAFLGNRIDWRGESYRLQKDGTIRRQK